ncbi:XrtA system polysaccharide chain length determinant [Marinobacter sp. X15-166B]|uniref:XrtA system polysaccharide chain length determinant n=1 Tax=Marinobacter sp. X15-166B TaxID=1897620 RepID=UPI00085CBED9|nr:XrtA system polysaccharide chain length determinant [Marinobacter sp. X15-166B]OEY67761.1 lipopolysaccharide biosynthesis protein [Marinobacter sp. X15-166B]
MALPLTQLPAEIVRELRARKWLVFVVFALISFAVLITGLMWPYKYRSEVIIYIDDSNIIQPLMEGSAVATKISERTSEARQTLWTRALLEQAATDTSLFPAGSGGDSSENLERLIAKLRAGVQVQPRGKNYFSIGFQSTSQVEALRVAQKLAQLFIENSNKRKRTESRSAYEFIDKQVKSYEVQLASVEQNLQEFLSENVDGTEEEATARMANLRRELEVAQLFREQFITKAKSLELQLSGIQPNIYNERTEDSYRARINAMQEQLDSLRLRYLDSYPDIIIVQEQLAQLKRQRQRALERGDTSAQTVIGESVANPLYQELRAQLVTANTEIETIETRIRSLNQLLDQQKERMERIQENKAQYAELTRDMQVNKQIYDDLLKRRERARVSMRLDVEGQGLNFRIVEAARYPLAPTGMQFNMFALGGLLLGALAPIGAIAGYLQIDPRVRSRRQLEDEVGLPVLVELPQVRTPFERRRNRRLTIAVIACAAITAIAYIAIVAASLAGVL